MALWWRCFLLVFLGRVTTLKTWHVAPEGKRCNDTHCFTLSNGTSTSFSHYFTNNTQVVFLPGTHYLNLNLTIMKVQNLTLRGWSGTEVIKCNHVSPLSISITWSSSITLQNLTLLGCGRHGLMDSTSFPNNTNFVGFEKCTLGKMDFNRTYTGIFFDQVRDINLNSITVSNTTGYGVYFYNCWGKIEIDHSNFTSNRGNLSYNGGNLYMVLWKNCMKDNKGADVMISSSWFTHGLSNLQYFSLRGIHAGGFHICSFCLTATIEVDESHFSHNEGGNVYIFMLNYINLYWTLHIKNSEIYEGRAYEGAGIYFASRLHHEDYKMCNNITYHWNHWEIRNTHFNNNRARYSGGGIKIQLTESDCKPARIVFSQCSFARNSIASNFSIGAALRIMKHEVPTFQLVRVARHELLFDQVNFTEHHLIHKTYTSVVKVEHFDRLTFKDSNFVKNFGTALSLKGSLVVLEGSVRFVHNTALNGGAVNLCESSSFFINSNTTITFDSNHADRTGGAIYIQESCIGQYGPCFFQPNLNQLALIDNLTCDMSLQFINNTAEVAGNSIYGGSIERCHTYHIFASGDLSHKGFNFSLDIVKAIFHFDTHSTALGYHVSSDAYKVQFCHSNISTTSLNMHVIPGKMFSVLVKTVGQLNGSSPGLITVNINDTRDGAAAMPVGYFEPTTKCSNFTLIVSHTRPGKQYSVRLKVEQNKPEFIYSSSMYAYINVHVDNCSWGFHYNNSTGQCECISLGKYQNIQCFLDDMTLMKKSSEFIWIGCDSKTKSCIGKDLLYGICGQVSYCIDELNVSVNATYNQCTEGRAGIACGTCRTHYSAQLGSSRCKVCTNQNLSILIFLIVAPFLLLILISALDITVSNGSIYGFLFYASFVLPLYELLLRHQKIHHREYISVMFSVISWFNLNIGIETCFFNGMTAYHKIWLEFGFLVYIWALEILIIRLCRRYVYFTRLCGKNIGKVLSTVLYMTLIKCAKLTFQCFVFIEIHNTSDNSRNLVWSPHTSMKYFSGYHIPLFLFATVMVAIVLVFVSSLLFIQFLRRQSFLAVVRRLLPFFETFSGPCNDTHAFWPGMIILVQGGFHLLLVSFVYKDEYVVLAISLASFFIIILSFLGPHGVYRKWPLNLLELAYMLNLFLLTFIMFFNDNVVDKQEPLAAFLSGVTAFISFALYHFRNILKKVIFSVYNKIWNATTDCRKSYKLSLVNVTEHSESLEKNQEYDERAALLVPE